MYLEKCNSSFIFNIHINIIRKMKAIEIYSSGALASVSRSSIFKNKKIASPSLSFGRTKIRAVGTVPEKTSVVAPQEDEEAASVKFAFVSVSATK